MLRGASPAEPLSRRRWPSRRCNAAARSPRRAGWRTGPALRWPASMPIRRRPARTLSRRGDGAGGQVLAPRVAGQPERGPQPQAAALTQVRSSATRTEPGSGASSFPLVDPLVTRARITDGRLAVAVGRLCGFCRGLVRGTRVGRRPRLGRLLRRRRCRRACRCPPDEYRTADTDRQRIGSSLRTAIELVAQSAGFNPAVGMPVPQFMATRQSGWVLYASWLRAFARTARSVR